MKDIFTKIEVGKIFISLDKKYYEKEAIFAAAHKFTDRFGVLIEPLNDKAIGIYFQVKNGVGIDEKGLNDAAVDFCNEVLDQQVRLDIDAKYGVIREMIVRQAFSPVSLSELSNTLGKNDDIYESKN